MKEDDKTIHLMAKIVDTPQNNQQEGQSSQQQSQSQQQQPQQQQQQQGQNPFAGMLGNFSSLLGFDPMAMIQQIAGQPQGVSMNVNGNRVNPNVVQAGGQGGNPFFGGFVMPGSPINLQQASNPNTNQSNNSNQPNQESNNQQPQSQPNQQPQQPQQSQQPQQNPLPASGPATLPFATLQNLGFSLNEAMGPGATFPGPPLPIGQRNNAQTLGGYLNQWHFQMSRLLPFISRTA